MVHPFSPESYPAGKIYKPAHAGSIVLTTYGASWLYSFLAVSIGCGKIR